MNPLISRPVAAFLLPLLFYPQETINNFPQEVVMSDSNSTPLSYSEKLKDPRWQKRRLEILQRDGWRCHLCANDERTLHVHHLFYFPGKEPWEINNGFLITLCEDCHTGKGHDGIPPAGEIILEATGELLNAIWEKGITGEAWLGPFIKAINEYDSPAGFPLVFKLSATPWKWEPKKNG